MSSPEVTSAARQPASTNAVELLRADHRTIGELFRDYGRVAASGIGTADRMACVGRIGALLRVHGRVEAELVYPALDGRVDAATLGRALADHADLETQVAALAALDPDAPDFAERVGALAAAVQAHVFEEERTLLPALAGLDLDELGARVAARRGALLTDPGVE